MNGLWKKIAGIAGWLAFAAALVKCFLGVPRP